ncbi:hypothetical protein JTB14_015818 [Gonioctena quinquepunctata]|nr:hypothetical protein JTB14_015818 [Gonioctena quinquepunctata]
MLTAYYTPVKFNIYGKTGTNIKIIYTNGINNEDIGVLSVNYGDYCKLSCSKGKHTVCTRQSQACGAGSKCGRNFEVIPLTDGQRQMILDIHNSYRNKVASGQQKGLPSAANMKTMTYNRELEFITQCWVNECQVQPLRHDLCRRTTKHKYVGQNLGWVGVYNRKLNLMGSINETITDWFQEVIHVKPSTVRYFTPGTQDIGHFTQMLWADTTEIGCAASKFTTVMKGKEWDVVLFGCDYGPGGNILRKSVYKPGKIQCGDDQINKRFGSLCGTDIPPNMTQSSPLAGLPSIQ